MRTQGLLLSVSLLAAATVSLTGFAATAADDSALVQALRVNDEATALHWIERRVGLNSRDETGATPLMWATQRGNPALTARLLEAGADPNIRNEEGLGPLQLALKLRDTDSALQLIARGADAKAARDGGETVLMTAARTGQIEAMRQLIARGADVNTRENQFHQTALMWSAGYPEQVRLLIAHGADVRARTKTWDVTNIIYTHLTHEGTPWHHDGKYVSKKGGQSALFFAIQRDDIESVKALLDAGLDVNDPAPDGTTPLLLAVYKWNPGGRRYGFNCDLEMYPLTFDPNVAIANLLLDRGAKVAVADVAGYTPLHGAALGLVRRVWLNKCRNPGIEAQSKDLEEIAVEPTAGLALVKRMLTLKADPNAATRYPTAGPVGYVRINPVRVGSTPVHIAALARNAELMRLLLAQGGDPDLIRIDGHSPLSLATQLDDLPLVKMLVTHGGDVKHVYDPTDLLIDDFNGSLASQIEHPRRNQTLLHIAAAAGSYQVVPFLAAKGVSLRLKNDKGETPLALAEAQERIRYMRNKTYAKFAKDAKAPYVRDPETIVPETYTSDALKQLLQVKTAAR